MHTALEGVKCISNEIPSACFRGFTGSIAKRRADSASTDFKISQSCHLIQKMKN